MAPGSTFLLPRFCSFPIPILRASSKKPILFSSSFLHPSSSQLHSQPVLLTLLSSPFSSNSSPSAPTTASASLRLNQSDNEVSAFSVNLGTEVEDDLAAEEEEENRKPLTARRQGTEPFIAPLPSFPSPKLTIKEKKELASYAHSLGKKLKSQQIGKSGVTCSVAAAMVESLESNELLKLKVHGSCPGELSDVIQQLESSTGSTAVSQIGRTLILYRPSLVKMKEDADRSRTRQQRKKYPIKSASALNLKRKVQESRTFS